MFLVVICLYGAFTATAQDKLFFRSGEELKVRVVEFGVSEVKYRLYEAPADAPVHAVEKYKILKVVLETGEEFTYSPDDLLDPFNYEGQKTKAIKVGFLSPLNNVISASFETSLRPGRSLEFGLGYIGAGFANNYENARGMTVNFGYKLINIRDNPTSNGRYAHLLKGFYIKPELIFAAYNADRLIWDWPNPSRTERTTFYGGAFLLTFGKQWVFDDLLLIDIYGGLGYGLHSEYDNQYGFVGGDSDLPLAGNAGIRIGLLIK